MKRLPVQRRTLALIAVIAPLLALLVYVALRSGPLAPVAVTVAQVESQSINPALFGIGTVGARYTYMIGPTAAGRVKRVDVHVGDRVSAGQLLAEMDPVDLDDRIRAQKAAIKQTQAAVGEATAKQSFAQIQARRYERLLAKHSTSEEAVAAKNEELQVANAALAAAREDLTRTHADLQALLAQRANLRLIAPVDGIVTQRDAAPGSTFVAGQAVVEMINPQSLWVDARFDQIQAVGLAAGQPASIVLRSRSGKTFKGEVLRVDPLADAVTEETLAKIRFKHIPQPLPPIGELADVTVALPALPPRPTVPNASLQRIDGKLGVWRVAAGKLEFVPVKVLGSDLDGQVQVEGLKAGERVVVYSQRTLGAHSNISIVDRIPGVSP